MCTHGHTPLKLLISIMTGPAVNHSGRMDLQKTEALGANYAGGNSHLIALSKNEPFFLSQIKSRKRKNGTMSFSKSMSYMIGTE